jgi:hypothetical protein
MPTPTFRVLHAVRALLGAVAAMSLALTFASLAEAKTKTVPAGFRVVDTAGRSLADGTQFSGPVTIKTNRHADCFGDGTGGSGAKVDVPGDTALGQLASGGTAFPGVDPLSVTDAFDFGLGLCGVGKAVSPPTGYWYLKVNHAAAFTGGDQTAVTKGDEILWYLIDDYAEPTPDELALKAPVSADPGDQIQVKVNSYADDGTKSAAPGVQVTGAEEPTDAQGKATVTVADGVTRLRATRTGSIPSNTVALCAGRLSKCRAGYAETIGGTSRSDKITGGAKAERILAGAGKDHVNARKGRGVDKINCGPGKDEVVLSKGSKSKVRSCEKVKYR